MRKLHTILLVVPLVLLLAGCESAAPIGAKQSPVRTAYAQLEANALSSGKPSADTHSLLHRYDLDELFSKRPDEAVRQLHEKASATGDRDLLFALAEMSFLTGEEIRRSVKPWESRNARDFYLGAAVYAYLFLLGDPNIPDAFAFDRRFRSACDLYNFGLGQALVRSKNTKAVVELQSGKRRLPVGEIDIKLDLSSFPWPLETYQEFVLGDQFLVRGLSVRNRQAGLGASLICVPVKEVGAGLRTMTASTAFLRLNGSLKEIAAGTCKGELELYSAFGAATVEVNGLSLPLETDLSVHMAYALNQSMAWRIERLQFLSLQELVPSGVYLSEPYAPGRIPVVFVHGTFSSPVWWAEMLNTLRADPEIRKRYQFWFFIYNSSAPVLVSAGKLRQGISSRIQALDPNGTDAALQQMVVIGHSQGGLLTKLTATDTGDRLWRVMSDKPLDELDLTKQQAEEIRRLFFLKPMPCVRRTVFISTPHRGSYRAGGFLRKIIHRLVAIPSNLTRRVEEITSLATRLKLKGLPGDRIPTSIDGMSPNNPVLKALVDIPIAPDVKAHSIIPVKGDGDFRLGSDGVVKYKSAHLENVESEFVLRHHHSCQDTPAAIEEVRRILHVHLDSQNPNTTKPVAQVEHF